MPRSRFAVLLLLASAAVPLRAAAPGVYAITGGTIHTAAGPEIANGVVIIRDGLVEAVGATVAIPPEATIVDASGAHVYPGLIDAHTSVGFPSAPVSVRRRGGAAPQTPAAPLPETSPAFFAARNAKITDEDADARRAVGVTTVIAAPAFGIFNGQSAVLNLSTGTPESRVIRTPAALQVSFNPRPAWTFPDSLMGVFAYIRQTLLDAQQYAAAHAIYDKNPSGNKRPDENESLAALAPVLSREVPVVFVADSELMMRRAEALATEFNLRVILAGARQGYRMAGDLKATPVLVSVKWASPPSNREDREEQPLRVIRERQLAPTTPAMLAKSGVTFALVSGIGKAGDFLPGIRKAIDNGLSADDALRAVTIAPAKIFGVDRQLGSLERGKIANVVISDKPLFAAESKITHVFVDGREVRLQPADRRTGTSPASPIEGTWNLTVRAPQGDVSIRVTLRNEEGSLTGTFAGDKGSGDIRSGSFDGTLVNFTISVRGQQETEFERLGLPGHLERRDAGRDGQHEPRHTAVQREQGTMKRLATLALISLLAVSAAAQSAPPNEGRVRPNMTPAPASGAVTVIRNATVLTITNGTIEHGSVVIRGAKIAAVGADSQIAIPAGAKVIDATGRFVMPGIIDSHSHTAVEGSVNEISLPNSGNVRIADVLTNEDISAYRQLAGGTTAALVLHGSANAIGGQSQIVKWKWGRPVSEWIVADAPRTIKFALGENPKSANFHPPPGQPAQYPATRMGVEEVIRDAFVSARDYMAKWDDYNARKGRGENPIPPRRDLLMEEMADILRGKVDVHAHCYRADEIMMLLNISDEQGFRIRELQHVLEGYKVAREIAAHGVGGGTFIDWWGYKAEAYDAIPYNVAMMERAGVLTSVNSDSDELARRLNQDAAKAMKYGGLSEKEALELCTINGARQLRLEHRIGSIEVGKDADLAIWTGHPLSTYSRVETTFIEGEVYFDRVRDLAMRQEMTREKRERLQKEAAEAKATAKPEVKRETR